MQRIGSALWPKLPILQVYGANTNVGKTIVSTLLCQGASRKEDQKIHYIKPVSTGPLREADDNHITKFAKHVSAKTLFQFSRPLSPHLAAIHDGKTLSDVTIQHSLYAELASRASQGPGCGIIETAGGVLSPSPSGSTQADLYRPLRLPVLLVGDHRLGGIATTISAFESLRIRGYDVDALILFDDDNYKNLDYLGKYFMKYGVSTYGLSPPPPIATSSSEDFEAMQEYYGKTSAETTVQNIWEASIRKHKDRVEELESMSKRAHETVWYPFTQHHGRTSKDIITVDSAYGDDFQLLGGTNGNENSLVPAMDGSASWWTQGLGHGNLELTLAASYASGRYGHVMFASAINKPAMQVVDKLLAGHSNERLKKVFFTDNGSTGMEVAIKMALRASCNRYGWDHRMNDVKILGLRGSYHGDTMGVVDASEPSVYNEKMEWYKPRGYWFEYPEIRMRQGKWYVEPPKRIAHILGEPSMYPTLEDIMSEERRAEVGPLYERYIEGVLSHLVGKKGYKFGGLVLEPMILGAGGMHFADPLFQRTLIEVVRSRPDLIDAQSSSAECINGTDWTGLPVVFDEVFTGLYRLGRFNCNEFLKAKPDIVVNAKLLTGGLVPLCTTTASQAIFDAFLGDSKTDALLHGHSYTAHAVGCNVASESMSALQNLDTDGSWKPFKDSWSAGKDGQSVWSMWSKGFVEEISHRDVVDHVFAIGNVLAIALKDAQGSGYNSTASLGLHKRLLKAKDGWMIHNRVLGNVVYFMTGQTSTAEHIRQVETRIINEL